jgi:hypothetical protein
MEKVGDMAQKSKARPNWKLLSLILIVLLVIAIGAIIIIEYRNENVNKYGFPYGKFSSGLVNVEFLKDGSAVYEANNKSWRVPVIYAINKNLYTEMMFFYPGIAKIPATYYWEYDGNELKFKLWGVDESAHRKDVMTANPYKRIK